MIIYKKDKGTGLECGLNDHNELFLGNEDSGYTLPFSVENKEFILNEFERELEREERNRWRVC